jgi:hypothetical protein
MIIFVLPEKFDTAKGSNASFCHNREMLIAPKEAMLHFVLSEFFQ